MNKNTEYTYTVSAQKQYRMVYQRTKYRLQWEGGERTFTNYQALMRFVNNDFKEPEPRRPW